MRLYEYIKIFSIIWNIYKLIKIERGIIMLKKYIENEFKSLKLYPNFWYSNKQYLCLELGRGISTSEDNYIKTVYDRAISIFKDLFNDNDDIIFVVNVYTWLDCINGDEERSCDTYYKSVDTIRLKQYLRSKKELKKVKIYSEDMSHENMNDSLKKIEYYYIKCKVKDIKYGLLIEQITKEELGYRFKGLADYFIINTNKHYVYRMCTDEYIDLVFLNNEDRLKIRDKYIDINDDQDKYY